MTESSRLEKPLAVVFWLLLAAMLVFGTIHGHKYFIDYSMYDRAGEKVLSGDVADIHELSRMETPKFHYSYFFAFVFAALTWLGPAGGRWVFAAAIAGSFLLSLGLSYRAVAGLRGRMNHPYGVLLLSTVLSIYALNDNFMTSNVAIFLLTLSIVAFHLRERSPVLAGLFLGAAIVTKVYPVTVLGFFVWEKNLRAAAWTVFWVFIFYLALPALFIGPKMAWHLIETQVYVLNKFGDHWPMDCMWFQCIPATVLRYLKMVGIESPWLLRGTVAVASLAVILFYLPSFLQPVKETDFKLRMFVLILALTALLLPICWYNVGIFYLPLGIYLSARWLEDKARLSLYGILAFGVLYCLTTPDILGTPLNDKLELLSVPFWGAFLMALFHALDTVKTYPRYFRLTARGAS